MSGPILLVEEDFPHGRPLYRMRSSFSLRTGIFSTVERLRLRHPGVNLIYKHPDADHQKTIASMERMDVPLPNVNAAKEVHGIDPLTLLDDVGWRIEGDLSLMNMSDFYREGLSVVGPPKDCYVHKKATILPGVVFDTRGGPIVVDAGVEVSSFSYLEGPLAVGSGSRIDNARITGGTIVGRSCRIGGEVENSIIQDFTNKHHEGFLGHSIVGSWVNLGALTTTSDLKNNYGEVRLEVPESFLPAGSGDRTKARTMPTGRIKLGSVIGDCAKTAIGTMLNTGTVLDFGCTVFGGNPPKYVPPLAWGLGGATYEPERFIADCTKIFARRKETPPAELAVIVRRLAGISPRA